MRSWAPTALVLAVAAVAHAGAAIPKDEGTLCRGLRTSPLPGTHASVGDCWQNSRCCHLLQEEQHNFSDTLLSHPNAKAQQRRPRTGTENAKKPASRPPSGAASGSACLSLGPAAARNAI